MSVKKKAVKAVARTATKKAATGAVLGVIGGGGGITVGPVAIAVILVCAVALAFGGYFAGHWRAEKVQAVEALETAQEQFQAGLAALQKEPGQIRAGRARRQQIIQDLPKETQQAVRERKTSKSLADYTNAVGKD